MWNMQNDQHITSNQHLRVQQKVWVAFASVDQQFHIAVDFVEGMTVADAIEKSQIKTLTTLPETIECCIFGVKVNDLTQILEMGDRVEIYRALTVNPKDKRRKRAAENPVGLYCRGNRFKLSK